MPDTAIMESIDPSINGNEDMLAQLQASIDDIDDSDQVTNGRAFQSLDIRESSFNAVTLFSKNEELTPERIFFQNLKCNLTGNIKVVSIIGSTGEGKSFTLNNTFFNGESVFKTSHRQESCTSGVWAAYNPDLKLIVLDTEGMQGISENEHVRTRMLMKVLAISDIVIYRTRSERLQNDMFSFLGAANRAFIKHFSAELGSDLTDSQTMVTSSYSNSMSGDLLNSDRHIRGPHLVIFHETVHTDPLDDAQESSSKLLSDKFRAANQELTVFNGPYYLGTRTERGTSTDFHSLKSLVMRKLENNGGRPKRNAQQVYESLRKIDSKFKNQLKESNFKCSPDEYFSCSERCQSCSKRCSKEVQHSGDHDIVDDAGPSCIYSATFENKVYSCKRCQENGRRVVVVPKSSSSRDQTGWVMGLAKYAWSGYVLECQRCGVIYRSRQQWFGNLEPENQGVVNVSIAHVWPGVRSLQGTNNAARRIIDGVTALSETVSEVSSIPANTLTRWAADQVAPTYWTPNNLITECNVCAAPFLPTHKIHHCRVCGQGVCSTCSNYKKPVPEKGWGPNPVRVCKSCYKSNPDSQSSERTEPNEVKVRKIGESVLGTVSTLANAFEYPISALKETARPDYWVPDSEITCCSVCKQSIGPLAPPSQKGTSVHHCRQCGKGVCNSCSKTNRPVRSRGWDTPVRVCDICKDINDEL